MTLLTKRMVTCRLRLIQTLVMLVTEEIKSLHQATARMLGATCYLAKQKKQNVVSRSSAEAKYHSMALTACEMVWLRPLLMQLDLSVIVSIAMHCDN